MVAIILAFIFLTPREKFGDQPRIPRASNIAMLPAENGSSMYWIDPELLRGIPENQRMSRLTQILKVRTGKKQNRKTAALPPRPADIRQYRRRAQRLRRLHQAVMIRLRSIFAAMLLCA